LTLICLLLHQTNLGDSSKNHMWPKFDATFFLSPTQAQSYTAFDQV